ncbi:PAS domain-containing protein [Dimargaris cristalligena]|uniref:PAS domain-containing protein n=1 Tax=Dimargaris cristalligena TaxID=215637 RepID=A0A4Q0A1K5_9FUNG|nr:PAS domain-containing protein [Dimargaris cristalligena]|eukprot:RKP40006.1 PAS domain-containing protein [Dimargaris cristalligena]
MPPSGLEPLRSLSTNTGHRPPPSGDKAPGYAPPPPASTISGLARPQSLGPPPPAAASFGLTSEEVDASRNPSLNSFPGLYSSTGFDMLTILAKVVNRSNAQINIGPVDMSCAFLVVDARKFDFPIVYASYSFEVLTGYKGSEIIGRNCRFLQAPDGHVTLGSRRRYTDNNTVFQIKNQTMQGKEVQVSLINYKKGGQPFINLVTVVPVCMETNEITYFVGFQVDLVEQPNAILEKMKDGSYIVNYSHLSLPPYLSPGFLDRPIEQLFQRPPSGGPPFPAMSEVFEMIGTHSDSESAIRTWNQMLLQHADDFIHVLSLKGVFLYCSNSCKRLLEFEPEELLGQNLSKICHPSDLVPVLREMKDVTLAAPGNVNTTNSIGMVYRARRKYSGYTWLEVHGRLHSEPGKGRKCVVLSGRIRPVYQMSREAFHSCGGAHEEEFWGKLSLDGLFLYVTSACKDVLGYDSEDLLGTSLYQMIRSDRTTSLTRSLQQAADGTTVRLRHFIQSKHGHPIDLVSTFYPGNATETERCQFLICQSRLATAVEEPPELSSTSSSAPSPQTNQVASESDNLFSLLDSSRSTTWQYEIHQLRLINKRLRDELDLLMESKKKKPTKRRNSPTRPKECSLCKTTTATRWIRSMRQNSDVCADCFHSDDSQSDHQSENA